MSGRHVVMFSGGAGSWAAAKRVAERHGTENLTLLFLDTLTEDPDLYRFLAEAAANVGGELVMLSDGRDIWQVFRDERMLGSSRMDPCSRVLKREPADRWFRENCDPATTVRYVGIDWSEEHRFVRLRERLGAQGWRVEAPMCEPPYMDKAQVLAWMRSEGIKPPRLYALGFPHNNCGGGCTKAGIGHFAHLLRVLPDVYAKWERNESAMQTFLGRTDVTILRDRSGGTTTPMSLRTLRERIEAGYQPDLFDVGGCGCFIEVAA